MLRRAVPVVVVSVLTLAAAGCNGGSNTHIGPLGASTTQAVTAMIQPPVVPIRPVFGFGCPLQPPFTTAFNIVLQQPAGSSLFVDRVTFHFLDGSNVTSAPVIFGRETPDGLGTLRFTPQFGCGIGTPQLVVADITMLDGFGLPFTVSTRAGMR